MPVTRDAQSRRPAIRQGLTGEVPGTGEIAIMRAHRSAVFDGERGQMRIHRQRTTALCLRQQAAQDAPMALARCGDRDDGKR